MGLGRGVPCHDIVASSHGLSCEYYCCSNQHGRHEGRFGHLILPMVTEAKKALELSCGERPAPGEISSRSLNEA
jgi:hypothetical protein